MFDAVIFDFDGVIVDSEPLHWRAFQRALAPGGFSFSWEEYLGNYVGLDDRDVLRSIFNSAERPLEDGHIAELIACKARAFQWEVAAGVVAYPGVVELIQDAALHGPVALCSGALRGDILPVLERLGLAGVFPVIVSAEEVSISKPSPESYTLALHRLGELFPEHSIRPRRCLAIEDTPAGIASARSAGMFVLAVTNSFPPEKLREADRTVETLDGFTFRDLASLDCTTPEVAS